MKTLDIKGRQVMIDDELVDFFKTVNWNIYKDGYVCGWIKPLQKQVKLHRYVIGAKPKEIADHINGNRLDNRLSNLRITDYFGNARNNRTTKNKHGYKGVYFNDTSKKEWYSQIWVNNGHLHLGCFYTKEEAALAYNKAAIKYFGEFAAINEGVS